MSRATKEAGAFPPNAERVRVALRASWQLEAIFDALLIEADKLAEVDSIAHEAMVRALALRGADLTSAIMSVLDDDLAGVDEHAVTVNGTARARSNRRGLAAAA